MFLSIITPVYNTEKYLTDCIESLLKQDLPLEEYEVIFINDGSTDNSASILDEFASRYKNFLVIHKENGGVSAARNIALDIARGDYIWFIDSDDFIEENVFGDIYRIAQTRQSERIQLNIYHMKSDYFTDEEAALYKAKKLIPGKRLICSAIYRADCINRNKTRFHPELTSNGDLVFGYELKKSIGGYKNVAEYEPIVYYYRKNGGSISNKPSAKKLNSSISLSAIMHEHAETDEDGFPEYTMVRYLYYSFHGMAHLPREERKHWMELMRQKSVFPVIVSNKGCAYYRAHYKTMKIKGVHPLIFKWMATPIGYSYVLIRATVSGMALKMRNQKK